METLSTCPACAASLSLFTPREIARHVNACLDNPPNLATSDQQQPPTCAVCARHLTSLTSAARQEHVNRCLDSLDPPRPRNHTILRPRPNAISLSSKPKSSNPDPRLRRFLDRLGLLRYAHRFEEEEVDFPALRLLQDSDFAHLRIPDAARRRIAGALTAVPILAHIQRVHVEPQPPEPPVVLTQNFPTSRLADRMQRTNQQFRFDDESEGEYAPTQSTNPPPNLVTSPSEHPPRPLVANHEEETVKQPSIRQDRDECSDDEVVPNSFAEIQPDIATRQLKPTSESDSSDVSSLASNPDHLNEILRSSSQITMEIKLRKWRSKQIRKENSRHKHRLQEIEQEYLKLVNGTQTHDEECDKEGDTIQMAEGASELLRSDQNCDTVDLTQDEPETPTPAVASASPTKESDAPRESIIISSNESLLRTPRPLNERPDIICNAQQAKNSKDSERDMLPDTTKAEHTGEAATRSFTTQLNDKEAGSEEDVIDLVSAGKAKRTHRRVVSSNVDSTSRRVKPLFSPSNEEPFQEKHQVRDESDEDFMNLVGSQKENETNQESTRSPEDPAAVDDNITARGYDSSESEEMASQSRLKKRPKKAKLVKATSQDIAQGIRKDEGLFTRILLMESVPFEDILDSLRSSDKHVTKKALHDFLQREGVTFKGESVIPGSQGEAYMRKLNSDMPPD